MSECTHDCSSCGSDCGSRQEPQSFLEKPNAMSNIGKVIGVVSGKGGVGKTLVSSLLAVSMQRLGKNVGIMDADITGPSIPKAFGIHQKADACEFGIIPAKSKMGLDIMSINLLLENESDPVVWRGPVIAGVVKQFWTDVIWKDIDCLVVDMPPGTGDVPLTVFQSLPVDGIVIVYRGEAETQEALSRLRKASQHLRREPYRGDSCTVRYTCTCKAPYRPTACKALRSGYYRALRGRVAHRSCREDSFNGEVISL